MSRVILSFVLIVIFVFSCGCAERSVAQTDEQKVELEVFALPISEITEESVTASSSVKEENKDKEELVQPELGTDTYSTEFCTEETLEDLLEKNREFYGMFLFYRGIKWIGESGDVVEIEFKNYENFGDFRNTIYSTYTEEYAAYLLENFLGKGEKSFFEDENGKIFINDYIFGTAIVDAFRYGRESYTFQIISSDSSVCEFLFSFRMWNEYGSTKPGVLCGEDTIVTLKCKAVREEDGWKLPYMICFEYDDTEIK